MLKKAIPILLLIFSTCVFSQVRDSVFLSYKDFITIVLNEHPYAKKAALKIYEGEASLLYAKGAFDPKLYTDISQKYFKGGQYYSQINSGLKIPTWFGIEVKGGYEQNQGNYLNPQNNTPDSGLLYAGISVPIGQGLLIDKRRADLKKAHLFAQFSEFEKQIILNELVLVSGITYWKWFKTYNSFLVYEDAHHLAKERYDAVKLSAALGSRPSIDTLEAAIQVQGRLLDLKQSYIEFKNTSALLSTYLWAEGSVPLELDEKTTPYALNQVSILTTDKITLNKIDSLINNHPELSQSRIKISQSEVDNRLKKNELLPVLNLKYNPITEYINEDPLSNFSINNYTWGLEFQMPIFLRKERGALKLNELKIQDYNLDLSHKQAKIRYKITSALNDWNVTVEQIQIYATTVDNASALLKGEQKLFDLGESSLFMINSRESVYIKIQLKYIELLTKNRNAELTTKYTLGNLVSTQTFN